MRAGLVEQEARTRRYYLGEEAYRSRHARLAAPRPARARAGKPAQPVRGHHGYELPVREARATTPSAFIARRAPIPFAPTRCRPAISIRSASAPVPSPCCPPCRDDEVERVLAANRKALETQYAFTPRRRSGRMWRRRASAATRSIPAASSPAPGGSAPRSSFPDGRVAGALSIAAIDSRMSAGAAARTRPAHEGRGGAHRRQAPHDVPSNNRDPGTTST